jgi:hypothetical protein
VSPRPILSTILRWPSGEDAGVENSVDPAGVQHRGCRTRHWDSLSCRPPAEEMECRLPQCVHGSEESNQPKNQIFPPLGGEEVQCNAGKIDIVPIRGAKTNRLGRREAKVEIDVQFRQVQGRRDRDHRSRRDSPVGRSPRRASGLRQRHGTGRERYGDDPSGFSRLLRSGLPAADHMEGIFCGVREESSCPAPSGDYQGRQAEQLQQADQPGRVARTGDRLQRGERPDTHPVSRRSLVSKAPRAETFPSILLSIYKPSF